MKKMILTAAVLLTGSVSFASDLTVGQSLAADIVSCGSHAYSLEVSETRDYTVTLNQTKTNMDLGLTVVNPNNSAGDLTCDTIGKDINESCVVPLEAGVEYQVMVDEWLCENDGAYELLFQ